MTRVQAILILVTSASVAHADLSARSRTGEAKRRGCRESQFAKSSWKSTDDVRLLKVVRDFDRDGIPDRLDATESHGNDYGGTEATLQLSRTKRVLHAVSGVGFAAMAQFVVVPDALVADAEARRIVEDALFDQVCDEPEAALLLRSSASAPGRAYAL